MVQHAVHRRRPLVGVEPGQRGHRHLGQGPTAGHLGVEVAGPGHLGREHLGVLADEVAEVEPLPSVDEGLADRRHREVVERHVGEHLRRVPLPRRRGRAEAAALGLGEERGVGGAHGAEVGSVGRGLGDVGEVVEDVAPRRRADVAAATAEGVGPEPLPAAVLDLDPRAVTVAREAHLDLGAVARLAPGVPRDDEAVGRLPGEHLAPHGLRAVDRLLDEPSAGEDQAGGPVAARRCASAAATRRRSGR